VLQIVSIVGLSAHLLLVDVAMAAPLVCVWLEWRATRRADALAGRAGAALARIAPTALTFGMVLGGLLLALRWASDDRPYFAAIWAIPVSRLWFGLAELVFSLACLAAYAALWNRWSGRRRAHRLLAIAGASNLLIHFPALFAILSVLSTRRDWLDQTLDRAGFQRMLLDAEVVSRVAHVWLAAVAATGVLLMLLARRYAAERAEAAVSWNLVRRGAWLALVPSLLQLPAGLWLAWQMPEADREPFLGGDLLAVGLFAVSLLLALALIHLLAAIALGDDEPKQIGRSAATLLVLVLLMVSTRSRLRSLTATERDAPPSRAVSAAAR
jgi:hypothetical protein